MDRLFVHVAGLLSERGVFYVVIVDDNDPGTLFTYLLVLIHCVNNVSAF